MRDRLHSGILLLLLASSAQAAVEFYVSPAGNDANPGTRERPFASPDHARQVVARRGDRSQPVTVFLTGGTYYLPDTWVFRAADSGTKDAPITYEALPGQTPVISGGQNNRPAPPHRQFRYVENIFEELDAPGEWFLNRKTDTLYFYPPADLKLDTATIEVVRLRHLVEFRGTEKEPVRFIALRGLAFRQAARTFMENKEPLLRSDWTTYRGGAIFLNGAEDCAIQSATIDQVPMDQFGVTDPKLKALARTPIGPAESTAPQAESAPRDSVPHDVLGAKVKNILGPGEISAYGLPGEVGALVVQVPAGSPAAKAGLKEGDVVLKCQAREIGGVDDLLRVLHAAPQGSKMTLDVWRLQQHVALEVRAE